MQIALISVVICLQAAVPISPAGAGESCLSAKRSQIRDIEVICLDLRPERPSQISERPRNGGERKVDEISRHAAEVLSVPQDFLVLDYQPDHRVGLRDRPDTPLVPIALAQSTAVPATEKLQGPHYRIGPGDELGIQVWRHPDLSSSVLLRPDGRISVPLVEDLYVEGKTTTEVASEIQERLSKFIQDPLVTVVVSGGAGPFDQQIRVVGQTARPAAIAYRDGMTILDVMISVGGLSPFADGNGALILRREGETSRQIPLRLDDLLDDGDSSANVKMAPGDIVIVPEGFFDGDWRLTQSAAFNQSYSDNIDREPSGEENAALITEIGPSWSIRANTARINAALNSLTQIRQQLLHENSAELRSTITGTSTIEFLEDFFFLDASVSSSRETIDTSSSGSDSDQDQVTSLSISPYIRNHFGSFADSELRLTLAQTAVASTGVSDDTTATANFFIGSGRDFDTFLWSLSGSASQSQRSEEGSDDIVEMNVNFGAEYVVSRTFSLLGSIGYQTRSDAGEDDDVDDPTWDVGFNWRPGPRTDLRMTYGQRDASESVQASFNYRVTSRTTIGVTYSEELETSQERLQADLAAISIDPETGELIDTRTDDPFDSNTSPFSIADETTRTRRLNARFSHSKQRDTYSVNVQGEEQSTTDGTVDERTISTSASWSRQINPQTTLSVSGLIRQSDRPVEDVIDRDINFSTTFSHQLYADLDWFAAYDFAKRFSDLSEDEFVENLFRVGVNLQF